jgi:hypothetical protein
LLFDNGCNAVSVDDDNTFVDNNRCPKDGGDLILLAVRYGNTLYDDDRSDLTDDNDGTTIDGGFIDCNVVVSLNDNDAFDNEGLSWSKFASELVTRSNDDTDFNSEDGDLLLLGVRSDSTLYDNNFDSEAGCSTLDDNTLESEGLSRSKFASKLITRSNDEGGDLIAFGVRSDCKLYDTDEILLDWVDIPIFGLIAFVDKAISVLLIGA